MSDSVRELTVILDRDMRTEDVQHVVDAIEMIKCVKRVKLGPILSHERYLAVNQAKDELRAKLFDLLKETW